MVGPRREFWVRAGVLVTWPSFTSRHDVRAQRDEGLFILFHVSVTPLGCVICSMNIAMVKCDRYEAACKFLERNGLLGIVRGHEAQDAGYVSLHSLYCTPLRPSTLQIHDVPQNSDQKVPFRDHRL